MVYGVYDLLERLGCRFVHPALDPGDPEIVPRSPGLTLPAGAWAVASPMKYRTLAWFVWRKVKPENLATSPERLAAQIDWAMKSRYNVFESSILELPPEHPLARALLAAKERGMLLQAPGHNFDRFLPFDPAGLAAHPEWFGLKNGKRVPHVTGDAQFCWTNREAAKVFTDNVVAFVKQRPYLDILELSGLDGGASVTCQCAECAKHNPTDNVIALLNGVVARLAQEAPNVVVETLGGYQYSEALPKDVKPDARLRVFWAHWGRSASISYANPDYVRREQLAAWARAFDGRLTAFQYYGDYFANSWFTGPLTVQIEGDRRFLVDLGIDGMLTLLYPDGFWWRASLNAYLAGRCFYDVSLDPRALLREYALAYYAPAGELLATYLDEWATHPGLGIRTRSGAIPIQLNMLQQQRRNYLLPAAARAKDDPLASRRIATILRLHALAEKCMAFDVGLAEARALRERGDLGAARAALVRSTTRLAEARQDAQDLSAERRGLVDPEIEWSTFSAKDQLLKAETKLLDQATAAQQASNAAPAPGASAPGPTAR